MQERTFKEAKMSFSSDTVTLVHDALRDFAGIDPRKATVLDFGCGRGALVEHLCESGVEAYGCDVDPYWEGDKPRLRPIPRSPYRLPFDDASFDLVVSTSVLEHAQNQRELFYEIKRVLKPNGISLHFYPGKWYLPIEPHIYVPLVNWLWPRQPRWWLALWAFFGIRNEFQGNMDWRRVTALNERYCENGLCYRTQSFYRDVSMEVFGNCEWPMHYYLQRADGGVAALYRKLPFKGIIAWMSRHTRMAMIVQRKLAA
jgi:SAM-dependent methyltransferase